MIINCSTYFLRGADTVTETQLLQYGSCQQWVKYQWVWISFGLLACQLGDLMLSTMKRKAKTTTLVVQFIANWLQRWFSNSGMHTICSTWAPFKPRWAKINPLNQVYVCGGGMGVDCELVVPPRRIMASVWQKLVRVGLCYCIVVLVQLRGDEK